MTVEELQVMITANTNDLRNELKRTQSSLSQLDKSTSKTTSGILKGFNFLKGGIIALGIGKVISSISSSVGSAVSRLDTLNNYPRVMSNLGVAGEDAQASMDRLNDKLQGLPTTINDAVASVQRFTSANGNVRASTDMFLALNNAVLSGGATMDIQKSALEQLSQAYSKGKPDMMEWRTAMSAMPGQLKQVAQYMGYASSDQLGEALRSGSVSMNEFMVAMNDLNKNGANGFQSFEEQARNSTGGVATSMTNVRTAITRGLAEVMNTIGQSNIASFFQGIAKAINFATTYVVAFVKVTMTAVNWISSLFGGGKKQATAMADSVKNASKSMGGLGGSATGTSKNIDKTTGSAKKLKKELLGLASFDEMNVLKSNSDDDSGGSGGSAGDDLGGVGSLGGMDGLGIDWDTEKTGASKVDVVVGNMLKSFDKIKNFGTQLWNSAPVQAYAGYVEATVMTTVDLVTGLGTSIYENVVLTWGNIDGNLQGILTNVLGLFTQIFTDMTLAVTTYAPGIVDSIVGLFDRIWKEVFDPYLVLLTGIWEEFTGILLDLWNEYGTPLVDNIGQFVTNIVDLFTKIYDDIIDPIVKPLLEELGWLWDNKLKGMIIEFGSFIGKLLNGALEIYNKFINPVATWLLTMLAPAFSSIASTVIGMVGSVVGFVGDLAGSIFKILGGIVDFITGIFTGNWKKAFQGLVDVAGGIMKGIASIVKLPINLVIDNVNGFIAGINKIKIPDWVPGVGGKGINIPKIPKLATGGIIDRPTIAMVGEAGKEAVMPLENNTGWISKLANQITSLGGVGGSGNGSSQPVHVTVKIGEDTILDKVVDGIKRLNFERNEEVIFV